MERADLYIVESIARALKAASKEGTITIASRLYDAASAISVMVANASGGFDLKTNEDSAMEAMVRSITRDLIGRVMKNPISGSEPTVQMPSLKEIAASTEFAEEAFPPSEEDEDL